nr:hypothetical protein [uncultured Kingella sp.]
MPCTQRQPENIKHSPRRAGGSFFSNRKRGYGGATPCNDKIHSNLSGSLKRIKRTTSWQSL